MLLDRFPQFYRSIPWQTTGEPIGDPNLTRKLGKLSQKAIGKFDRTFNKVGIPIQLSHRSQNVNPKKEFANPAHWMRQEPTRAVFEQILNNRAALYPEYLDREQVKQDWHEHLKGRNLADRLSLTISLELWLQQVFEKRYRSNFVS